MTVQGPLGQERSFYEQIGGHDAFVRLVGRFYAGVAGDPVLRALYPEEDLGPAAERLRMFLEQYWGGPTTYSEQRGHPRLRMRHAPFRGRRRPRGTAGCTHMRAAVESLHLRADARGDPLGLPRTRRVEHGQHAGLTSGG